MKKIILSMLIGGTAFFASSQVVVVGVSPAAVQGNYTFAVQTDAGWPSYTPGQFPDSENWGMPLDFSVVGTYIQDTLVLVNDGTAGTDPNLGNPLSQEGCNPTAGNPYAGKIAVLRRNTCSFVNKALYAQNAGAIAVIVVDNIDDANLANNFMSAADTDPNGPLVTIPVVRISMSDGNHLINQMANGPVVMFIGNKTGAFQNDLSLNQDLVMTPPYHGVHSLLAQNGTEFNFDLGLRVYNFGGSNQSNATVNATVKNPSGATVYDEDVMVSLNQGDSIDIFPGEANAFPQFSLATYPAGKYTVEYTILLDGIADDFDSDNTYMATFVVNNSYLSRARLDETTLKPITMSQVKPAAPTGGGSYAEVVYCSSFRNANASRLAVSGFNATVSVDSVDANSTLEGKFVFADLYEWTNADAVYAANAGNTQLAYDLTSRATLNYDFANDVIKEEAYFEFETPYVLQDNVMYMVCITDFGQGLNIGYDRGVNFNATRQLLEEWINPLKVVEGQTVTWYGAGFGPDLTPAFGIRAIDATTVAVENLLNLEGKAYPNPTDDVINMNIPLDGKATVSVTDLSGRTVANREVTFMGNQASIDLAELQSGMYVINVAYDNGSKSAFNVVKK
ncbi:T9SS type A sorting domain-containing protein [Crocinitomicaceae bacterium CZZ-1]|uniref:T9SS type A sorting domain-containing protein n=1 Tax=Taishania pollutisoli TaxID=2766479 RepID=A0A8J6PB96_9FLAO|nr:T9SS type A sorting domain-containing protein [Taishania pollutisoli]MBC9811983.1 T9SS type A sorting domain-containing protein [Taishania pollutisoli]MBX2949941.1 T9SS type A sorting domain-containing protein [Crocinitomicaceae bacterium]